ncbi:MAG: peptidoglycan editing factor PgeF [Acidobacteria bacterium]|nr:peptidoglycan editing factor PgeF [Acidobacteriota bacterium]
MLRVPALARFPWLIHGFSTRQGGVSSFSNSAGHDLNLGKVAWDTSENIAQNRRRLLSALKAEQMELVGLRQIHSDLIRVLDGSPAGTSSLAGDGLVTQKSGELLSIQVADCLPVLLVDSRQRVVAALHCGWRGTARRLAQKGVGVMKLLYGSRSQDLWAAIGPGIRACCYAVGNEVAEEFRSQFHYAGQLLRPCTEAAGLIEQKFPALFQNLPMALRPPRPSAYLDLVLANNQQLRDAGIPAKQIYSEAPCSSCRADLFFSHRRDNGITGRMMGMIGIRT